MAKENVIKNNLHKYSVSAMCKVLQLSRSTYYYEAKQKGNENILEAPIMKIFKDSRSNYGARKIKIELEKEGYQVSERKISRIMRASGLISKYTIAQFKPHVDKCNESKVSNLVKREFKNQSHLIIVVSDLTYVCVDMS